MDAAGPVLKEVKKQVEIIAKAAKAVLIFFILIGF
jgi:hypothetical protein